MAGTGVLAGCLLAAALGTTTGTATAAPTGGARVPVGPVRGGVVKPHPVPAFPGLYALVPTAKAVTVSWYDRSTDERSFILYRRDKTGTWRLLTTMPTRSVSGGGDYSYVDTDTSLSGQCYLVGAVSVFGTGYAKETCTVRPDPARFPQDPPPVTAQWSGLSSSNDGTGPLYNKKNSRYLKRQHETFGVDLGWGYDGNNVKLERQGAGTAPLMKGEAVAVRVWGAGWLVAGHQTWGIDLRLSSTPSYEWYVVEKTPGQSLDNGYFGLYNGSRHDFLVAGHETFGVDLNWYRNTLPPPPPPPPPPPVGVKTFVAYNCISEARPLEMWVADLTTGTGYVDKGRLDSQWSGGGCPQTGSPWVYSPPSGHQVLVRSVDLTRQGCANDPQIGDCWRSSTTFRGDANGQVVNSTIG